MKYLICNLKAKKEYEDILSYLDKIKSINTSLSLIIAPPILYLPLFKDLKFKLCAQNIPLYEHLEITGDITFKQIKSLGVEYIFIGHYERRKYYGENDYTILNKVKTALKENMKVIYFIGETKEELDRRISFQKIGKDLIKLLNDIKKEDYQNLIIAYEPTYLIGSDIEPDYTHIYTMINFIKEVINTYYHVNIDLVYGGNVNSNNINNLLNIPNCDGFILGNSSLDPEEIEKILEKLTTT